MSKEKQQHPAKASPDQMGKVSKKRGAELTEEELRKASGGTITKYVDKT